MTTVILLILFGGLVHGQWPCPKDLPCVCYDPYLYSIDGKQGKELNVVCYRKSLTSPPPNIPRSVTHLDLSFNEINHLKNKSFEMYGKLTYLSLRGNDLKTLEVDAFLNLNDLKYLSLKHKLHSKQCEHKYKTEVFNHLTNLKTLITFNNRCFSLDNLKALPNLKMLSTDVYNTTLPSELSYATQLKFLTIQGPFISSLFQINITSTFFKILSSLKNLEQLVLRDYYMTDIADDAFSEIKNLKMFGLTNIRLVSRVASKLGKALNTLKQLNTLNLYECDETIYFLFQTLTPSNMMHIITIGLMPGLTSHLPHIECTARKVNFTHLFPSLKSFLFYGYKANTLVLCDLGLLSHPTLEHLTMQLYRYSLPGLNEYVEYNLGVILDTPMDNTNINKHSTFSMPHTDNLHLDKQSLVTTSQITDRKSDPCWINSLPPNLISLDITRNPSMVYNFDVLMHELKLPKSLETLTAASNHLFFQFILINCSEGSSLSAVDFSYNHYFSFDYLIKHANSCQLEKLKQLKISHCQLNWKFTEQRIKAEVMAFKKLSALEEIQMGGNELLFLPLDFFSSQTQMRVINLTVNSISNFQFNTSHMKKLNILDLAYNRITRLSLETIHMFKKQSQNRNSSANIMKVFLEGNPLCCSCKCLDFIIWLKIIQTTNSSNLLFDFNAMSCFYENGTRINMANMTNLLTAMYHTCTSYNWIYVSILSFILFNLAHIIWSIWYKNRWKIRYMWYKYKLRKKHKYEVMMPKEVYAFDSFVVFTDNDRFWIREHMIPIMEEQAGFHLCIHLRDFPLGHAVIENIYAAFEFSKITVVMLTNAFLKSSWCMYELTIAQSMAVTRGKGSLIIMKMEELDNSLIPSHLAHLLNTQTYLEWDPKNPEVQSVFWQKLYNAMKVDFHIKK